VDSGSILELNKDQKAVLIRPVQVTGITVPDHYTREQALELLGMKHGRVLMNQYLISKEQRVIQDQVDLRHRKGLVE
jgi:hypothetical protein